MNSPNRFACAASFAHRTIFSDDDDNFLFNSFIPSLSLLCTRTLYCSNSDRLMSNSKKLYFCRLAAQGLTALDVEFRRLKKLLYYNLIFSCANIWHIELLMIDVGDFWKNIKNKAYFKTNLKGYLLVPLSVSKVHVKRVRSPSLEGNLTLACHILVKLSFAILKIKVLLMLTTLIKFNPKNNHANLVLKTQCHVLKVLC